MWFSFVEKKLGRPQLSRSFSPFVTAIILLVSALSIGKLKIISKKRAPVAKKIYQETNVGSKNVFVTDKYNTGVAAILINKETGDNAISVVPGAAGKEEQTGRKGLKR